MVTAGFIVEGDSESILLKDDSFINFLSSINIACKKELVINAQGKNNLYHPHGDFNAIERKVTGWLETLKDKGADAIFFLIDFDNSDTCFTAVKEKIFKQSGNTIIVAKQALEAWYLADEGALTLYLKKKIAQIENPEIFINPFEKIKELRNLHKGRGISDKKILTKDMIRSGFSLLKAAAHPNCLSAKYFVEKLRLQNELNNPDD